MAKQVKAPAKPDDLCSVPESHKVQGKNNSYKLSWLPHKVQEIWTESLMNAQQLFLTTESFS